MCGSARLLRHNLTRSILVRRVVLLVLVVLALVGSILVHRVVLLVLVHRVGVLALGGSVRVQPVVYLALVG
jgi:hypothetical protein